jgi:hypothetical protein
MRYSRCTLPSRQGTGSIFSFVCGHEKISTLEPLTAWHFRRLGYVPPTGS